MPERLFQVGIAFIDIQPVRVYAGRLQLLGRRGRGWTTVIYP